MGNNVVKVESEEGKKGKSGRQSSERERNEAVVRIG